MAATNAPLCDVDAVAVDTQGRVYFGSSGRVWMIGADGSLVLIAGNGGYGNKGDGGLATAAEIGFPGSIVIDASGNLYLADDYNFAIRKVTSDKRISTVTTVTDVNATLIALALDASGTPFYVTGTTQVFKLVQGASVVAATVARPNDASCLAVDPSGALYFCSSNTQRLFRSVNGSADRIAGAYPYDVDGLPASAMSVHLHLNPLLIGLAVDANNNVYFPELDGDLAQRIDKLAPTGILSALNTPALLPTKGAFSVQAIAISPSGGIYFSTFTQVYRAEPNGSVTLIAGAPGFPPDLGDGGLATAARLSNPSGLAFDQNGNLYITEPFDSRVRKVNTQNLSPHSREPGRLVIPAMADLRLSHKCPRLWT